MTHDYTSHVAWTGNRGEGTAQYRGYDRTWDIAVPGKSKIHCSNDPLLGGDSSKMNPEDLLLSALSSCHMLWYLHLASNAKIVVHQYTDIPLGTGEVNADGSGKFFMVVLRQNIIVASGTNIKKAESIHYDVHRYCFIARSMNFPITYEPTFNFLNGR